MNYQKEYAILVGEIDRALTLLEADKTSSAFTDLAVTILRDALREAEERYMEEPPAADALSA